MLSVPLSEVPAQLEPTLFRSPHLDRREVIRRYWLAVLMTRVLHEQFSAPQHLMLLYRDAKERNDAAIDQINQALKNGHLAVYASVLANDPVHMEKFSSNIPDFREHVEQGNLLVVRLHSFYERVLTGSLEPFEDLKAIFEEILKERIDRDKAAKAVVVADCADMLSRNEKFDECVFVERWWRDTHSDWLKRNVEINVVCPHPATVLEQEHFAVQKRQISGLHSLTVDAISK